MGKNTWNIVLELKDPGGKCVGSYLLWTEEKEKAVMIFNFGWEFLRWTVGAVLGRKV